MSDVLAGMLTAVREMREGYIRLELDLSLDEAKEVVELLKKMRKPEADPK